MYAVVELKWHQYIVQEWDTITVDNVDLAQWETLVVDKVLLAFDDKAQKVVVGTPNIANAKVEFTVNSNKKWDKIRVIKFKRKNRYTRTIGFRPHQSVLDVKKITL